MSNLERTNNAHEFYMTKRELESNSRGLRKPVSHVAGTTNWSQRFITVIVSNTFRSALVVVALAAAVFAMAATTWISPASASEPFPTNHLSNAASPLNPKAYLAGGGPHTMVFGTLLPTRYLVVQASQLVGVPQTTINVSIAGGPARQVAIKNNETVVLDFGGTYGGTALLTIGGFPGHEYASNATNLVLDMWTVGQFK